MDTSLSAQEAQGIIESSGQIPMHAFQVTIGVFTGLALGSFVARMIIRLRYHKQLRLDDAFLIFAVASLCAATGILYDICYFLYLHSAALLAPEVLPEVLAHYEELLGLHRKVFPFLALSWTTTFAVKGCFLAFMRPLTRQISRVINWYYWFVVGFSIVAWAYCVVDPFIICPYFGADSIQCFTSSVDGRKTLGLTALVTVLDILSDIMVVSIPIIILKGSLLSRSTKIGLSIFFGISVFMTICAIARISGFYYQGVEDDVWEFFWQQVEGAVAVIMASITAFRTLFVKQQTDASDTAPPTPMGSFLHRLLKRFRSSGSAEKGANELPSYTAGFEDGRPIIKLPKMPSPVFTGLRTFVWRINGAGAGDTTLATMESVFDSSETDYHIALKAHMNLYSFNTSSNGRPSG